MLKNIFIIYILMSNSLSFGDANKVVCGELRTMNYSDKKEEFRGDITCVLRGERIEYSRLLETLKISIEGNGGVINDSAIKEGKYFVFNENVDIYRSSESRFNYLKIYTHGSFLIIDVIGKDVEEGEASRLTRIRYEIVKYEDGTKMLVLNVFRELDRKRRSYLMRYSHFVKYMLRKTKKETLRIADFHKEIMRKVVE